MLRRGTKQGREKGILFYEDDQEILTDDMPFAQKPKRRERAVRHGGGKSMPGREQQAQKSCSANMLSVLKTNKEAHVAGTESGIEGAVKEVPGLPRGFCAEYLI